MRSTTVSVVTRQVDGRTRMIRPFLDTNVLIYAYELDSARSGRALAALDAGGSLSVNVLNEFVDVARRKLRFSWDDIERALADFETVLGAPWPLTAEVHRGAIAISRRFGFRIYDSLTLSAARLAGSSVLLSEDMRHGQMVDGVEIINPFL